MYICKSFVTIKAEYKQNFLPAPLKSLSPSHLHSSHITKKSFIYLLGNVYWFLFFVKVKLGQLCPTLCGPMNWGLQVSFVHGILQAILLEWASVPFSRGSSQPRDRTLVSHTGGRFFTVWATRDSHNKFTFLPRF